MRDEFQYNDSLQPGWVKDLIAAADHGTISLGSEHVSNTVLKMLGIPSGDDASPSKKTPMNVIDGL